MRAIFAADGNINLYTGFTDFTIQTNKKITESYKHENKMEFNININIIALHIFVSFDFVWR